MRKIILLLMLLIAYGGLQAQNAMVLKMKDGTKNVVYLRGPESSPTMVPFVTFEGGDIVIHGDHELRLPMSTVQRYTYTDSPDAITTVELKPVVLFKGNEIALSNHPAGTVAMVYNVSGMLVKRATSTGGDATISLAELPKGVYVITIGSSTYKFMKR